MLLDIEGDPLKKIVPCYVRGAEGAKMSEDDGEVIGICIHKYLNTTSRER